MKELFGDLLAYYKRPGYVCCITTNGFVKKDGTGVMGRGTAKQAADIEPKLPALLGRSIKFRGNKVSRLTNEFLAFPTKHNWYENSDLKLIEASAFDLSKLALATPQITYILPRPGCSNGNLRWEEVKPLLESVNFPDNVWIIATWEERPR